MTWPAVLLALIVSHLAGDFLLQSEWQAINKTRGLGETTSRRALLLHLSTYMLAYVPALVWIGDRTSPGRAVVVGVLVAIPHLLIDDGRFVRFWLREVKGAAQPALGLTIAVDQSFHVICLLGVALLAVA